MTVSKSKLPNGEEVTIRYPEKGDVAAMLEYINILSAERTFILSQGEQLTLREEDEMLTSCLDNIAKGDAVMLLAFISGNLVGISSISRLDKIHSHLGNLGISIAKEYRGRGIGHILTETLLKEAVDRIKGMRAVILEVFSTNLTAIDMYKKFGFIEYGRLPKGVKHKDEFVDDVMMYKSLS